VFRWFRRQWHKHFVRVIYSPEVEQLGPILDGEWEGLLADLAQGYERHKPVFRAVQILLKRAEKQALRLPSLATPADLALWQAEQLAAVANEEAEALPELD